jgi:hypothetical protein
MPSNNTRQTRWYPLALNDILKKHGLTFTPEQTELLTGIHLSIDQLKPTVAQDLEILRLFEESLNKRGNFKNEEGPLDLFDLFYASALLSLKVTHDENEVSPSKMLPKKHRYSGCLEKAPSLEYAFIEGIDWKLHPNEDKVFEAYTALLAGLNQLSLTEFSASFLLSSLSGSGDSTLIHKVLCKLNPELGEKTAMAMQGLKELPLTHCYINNDEVKNQLKKSLFDFLQGTTPLLRNEAVNLAIENTLQLYFNKRNMLNTNLADLHFYLKPEIVNAMHLKDVKRRLHVIESALPLDRIKHTMSIFRPLWREIETKSLTPDQLSKVLPVLEVLSTRKTLSKTILTMALHENKEHMLSILNAYAAICREGWLVLINQNENLDREVAQLVRDHHASADLITSIHEKITAHFEREKPTYNNLKHLHSSAVSTQGKQLAFTFMMKSILENISLVETKLKIVDGVPAEKHQAIVNYFNTHPEKHMDLFSATHGLTYISHISNQLTTSLYLNILSEPAQMRFKVRIALALDGLLARYSLLSIRDKMADLLLCIYAEINKNTEVLKQLNAYFNTPFPCENDMNYQLSRTPLLKPLVKNAIEQAVARGDIALSITEESLLSTFYFCITAHPYNQAKKMSSSSMILFSPIKSQGEDAKTAQCVSDWSP